MKHFYHSNQYYWRMVKTCFILLERLTGKYQDDIKQTYAYGIIYDELDIKRPTTPTQVIG